MAEPPTNANAGSGHIADDPMAAFMGFVGRIRDAQSQAAVLSLMHEAIGCLGADACVFVGVLPDDALHRSVWTLIDGGTVCQCMHRDDWYLGSGNLLSGNGCWCTATVDLELRGGCHYGSRSAEDFCLRSSVRIALPGTSGLGRRDAHRLDER